MKATEEQKQKMRKWHQNNHDYWQLHVKEYAEQVKSENHELWEKRRQLKNKYMREWKNKNTGHWTRWRKRRLLEIFASRNNKCERCDFDNILALQLHHKNGRSNNESKTKILARLYLKEHIEVLCANCHLIIHRGGKLN